MPPEGIRKRADDAVAAGQYREALLLYEAVPAAELTEEVFAGVARCQLELRNPAAAKQALDRAAPLLKRAGRAGLHARLRGEALFALGQQTGDARLYRAAAEAYVRANELTLMSPADMAPALHGGAAVALGAARALVAAGESEAARPWLRAAATLDRAWTAKTLAKRGDVEPLDTRSATGIVDHLTSPDRLVRERGVALWLNAPEHDGVEAMAPAVWSAIARAQDCFAVHVGAPADATMAQLSTRLAALAGGAERAADMLRAMSQPLSGLADHVLWAQLLASYRGTSSRRGVDVITRTIRSRIDALLETKTAPEEHWVLHVAMRDLLAVQSRHEDPAVLLGQWARAGRRWDDDHIPRWLPELVKRATRGDALDAWLETLSAAQETTTLAAIWAQLPPSRQVQLLRAVRANVRAPSEAMAALLRQLHRALNDAPVETALVETMRALGVIAKRASKLLLPQTVSDAFALKAKLKLDDAAIGLSAKPAKPVKPTGVPELDDFYRRASAFGRYIVASHDTAPLRRELREFLADPEPGDVEDRAHDIRRHRPAAALVPLGTDEAGDVFFIDPRLHTDAGPHAPVIRMVHDEQGTARVEAASLGAFLALRFLRASGGDLARYVAEASMPLVLLRRDEET